MWSQGRLFPAADERHPPAATGGAFAAPILLTASRDALGADARSFLADNDATIGVVDVLGGPGAVSDVADAVAAARGG